MSKQIIEDGSTYPWWTVTGYWCPLCGWPASPALESLNYGHPWCLWNAEGGHRG